MINLTEGGVVFNTSGTDLADAIGEALWSAAFEMLTLCGLGDIDLTSITTKVNSRAAFAKFVNERVLVGARKFDKAYVCAQHGRELMGWKSPVGVPTWTHREQG